MSKNAFNHTRLARVIAKQTLYGLDIYCLPENLTDDETADVMRLVIEIADRITKEDVFSEKVSLFRENPKSSKASN